MSSITLTALHKRYGEVPVLQGVDLHTEAGEYIVLVGPSGCGKSTLLRCIAGLEDITSGTLRIGAREVTALAPRDRNVAMVFQSYALYPHMTVRENMGFALRVAGRPIDEIRVAVDEAAEMLDLGALLDRMPAQLSGGQRQRVAMGRAIVRRPEVFLFDEPLSNLDAALRHHMRVELKRLHRRLGATIVHVTHDQVEALTLADRILVLNKGVVQQYGSPRELFDRPANVFVATFIGSPSMNLLDAVGEGSTSRIAGVQGAIPVPGQGPYRLGVRPSDLRLDPGSSLIGRVDVVESLGASALVHLVVGERPVIAEWREPVGVSPGELVGLALDVVHRFDAQSGERLADESAP